MPGQTILVLIGYMWLPARIVRRIGPANQFPVLFFVDFGDHADVVSQNRVRFV